MKWAFLALALVACSSDTFVAPDGSAEAEAAAACPDLQGRYSVSASGDACPSNMDSNLCVVQSGCIISIQGVTVTAPSIVVSGDGSFSGASVREGLSDRTGCTGSWDPKSLVLTVVCGGNTGTQSCVLALTQSSPTCK